MSSHPEQSLLLSYIDGELPALKLRQVASHVEACGDCRAEVEQLKETIADCVRYRREFIAEAMPEPPRAWADLYEAFARIEQDTPQRTGLLQVVRGKGFPWRWAVGASTVTLAVAGALYFGVGGTSFLKKAPSKTTTIAEPQLLRNGADSGSAPMEVPPRPVVPSRPAANPGLKASVSDELQVLKALHGIGADLGDPLHISLSDRRVLVAGLGVTPARQEQIRAALEALPRVSIEFTDPSAPALPPDIAPSAVPAALADSPSPFQSQLAAQLGGRSELDRFSGQALNWNETLMSHAYALRMLAQQFPDDAALNDSDRASLHALANDHISAMSVPADQFERELAPVLTALGAKKPAAISPADAGTAWQGSAALVFQAASRVEMLSSLLLGVARGEKSKTDLPSELLGAVSDLRIHLEQNQRLLGR